MIPPRSYSNMTSPGEGGRVVPVINEKSDNGERVVCCTWFGPPPFFKEGSKGSKFWIPLPPSLGGGIWKIKKRGWSMVPGKVFSKRGGLAFSYLIFQGLSFLYLEITLLFAKLCYLKKKIFFCHHCMKKYHSKLSKNEPENIPKIKITYLQRDLTQIRVGGNFTPLLVFP